MYIKSLIYLTIDLTVKLLGFTSGNVNSSEIKLRRANNGFKNNKASCTNVEQEQNDSLYQNHTLSSSLKSCGHTVNTVNEGEKKKPTGNNRMNINLQEKIKDTHSGKEK